MLHRKLPKLTHKNLVRARKMLLDVAVFLEAEGIDYHLEGGTLLGIVRDKELLPWDHDIDISIPSKEVEKFLMVKKKLYWKGYKVSIRRSRKNVSVFKEGQYTLFKVKKLIPSLIKSLYPWYSKNYIVLDIFVKVKDENYCYWQAQGKLLRVENKYYELFETIEYQNTSLRIPNFYRDYLTQKYGDWSVPVKEWECGKNERTICDAV